VSGRGWVHQFRPTPWEEVATQYKDLGQRDASFRCMVEIVDSILTSRVADQLAGQTSMHDLIVVDTPIPEPPLSWCSFAHPTLP
jgi:hypothetical protein